MTGVEVKQILIEKRLTQRGLARVLKVSNMTVNRALKTGEVKSRLLTLVIREAVRDGRL